MIGIAAEGKSTCAGDVVMAPHDRTRVPVPGESGFAKDKKPGWRGESKVPGDGGEDQNGPDAIRWRGRLFSRIPVTGDIFPEQNATFRPSV